MNLKTKFVMIMVVSIPHILLNLKTANSQSYRIFINEFMASNQQTISDDDDEYDDWIEIYNAENFDFSLAGYYLTDELNDPVQWAFPAVTIPANGYLLIWADDDLFQTGLHTNFKLSNDGEQIGLYNGTAFVDSITYGPLITDVSLGRESDGAPNWVAFESPHNPPTPGSTNQYNYNITLSPPNFYPDEGFYTGNISVALTSIDSGAVIYYTIDGSLPTTSSNRYTNPIPISSSTTIRAICHRQLLSGDEQISQVITRCYLLNINNAMPLINIACDPDEHDDIYNHPQVGESHPTISAHYKYFDTDHTLQGDLPIALSMRGAYSLLSPKRSYRVAFSRQNLQYDLFDQVYNYPRSFNYPNSFHSHNLNGMAADYSLIRNYLSFQLLRNAGANTAQVSFARLFINGDDRGIYVPIERIDDWFVKNRFGNYEYDIIKTGIEHKCDLTMQNENGSYFEVVEGDFNAFHDFIVWLNSDAHDYASLNTKLDIPSFLYYDLMCRYSNNKDSYDINYYFIRNRDIPGSKWTILLWDTDESFGWDSHVSGHWYPFNQAFYRLRQTNEYMALYQNTLADLMNTLWSQFAVSNLIIQMEDLFSIDNTADELIWNEAWYDYAEGVIPDFNNDPNYNPLSRYTQFNYIKQWIGERIDYLYSLWDDGRAALTIDSVAGGEGSIQLNSLHLTTFPWTGTYFKGIPISLKAIPGPGHVFVGWSDSSVVQTAEITIYLQQDYRIHPIFELNTQTDIAIINEINYNSSTQFDAKDWIELYNPSEQIIDLNGWHLKDNDDTHDFVFPAGIRIAPHGFLVICRDMVSFRSRFPGVTNYIGDIEFGLSSTGDQVRIYNSSLLIIDSVAFDNEAPWPTEPDGYGATLELIDPGLDNTRPENWQASMWHGTPGQPNSFPIVINEINYNSSLDFNPDDWIELYNPADRTVDVSGWHLKDADYAHDFNFPPGTTIDPHGFLIVCFNRTLFQSLFPSVTNVIGNFIFGLSGSGDDVKIYNASYNLVDSVTYDDIKPWPIEPDGNGPTLELLDPGLDNTQPQHWQASPGYGSPGQVTRALPVITSLVVKDSSGSAIVTNSRDVLIKMTATDYDGQIVKWHINESGINPLPDEFLLENRPTSYHIDGAEGEVTIYGWALDNDLQVSRLTDTSYSVIRLVLGRELYDISGSVGYDSKERSVTDVIMTLNSHGTDSDTTDENGNYIFTDLDTGFVTLTPFKSGDIRDAIRGSDALLILQYLAGLTNMSDDERLAADVVHDMNITSSDAVAILRFLALFTNNIGMVKQWRFLPEDFSLFLKSDTTIDYRAYLVGDPNLDWDQAEESGMDSINSDIRLCLKPVNTYNQRFIHVPLTVETDSEAVNTVVLSLDYDPGYLKYHATEKSDSCQDFIVETNGLEPGKVHVAMAGVNGVKSIAEMLQFRFEVVDPLIENQRTQLKFIKALVNDQSVATSNGEVIFTDSSGFDPIPVDYALYQNFPNPFNSETRIRYQVPHPGKVRITIYNLMGNEIRTIENDEKQAGNHYVNWDGKDDHGTEMPSGIYIYKITANGFVQSMKMIMIK